jgi:hypothetical protein
MSKVWTIAGLALALAAAGACGKSAEQQRAEEAAKQLEEAAKKMEAAGKEAEKAAAQGAEGLAAGMEALAKGLGAAADAANGGKKVDPVPFRDLQAVFVDFPGWEKNKPTGEQMTAPFAISKAEVTYTKGDSRIRAELTDSAMNQLMLIGFSWVTNVGYEKQTQDGWEKAAKIAGHPGLETWRDSGKHGEVTVLANKRYVLELKGDRIDDTKVLHQLAEAMALGNLPSAN